jgi:hypothetical protein
VHPILKTCPRTALYQNGSDFDAVRNSDVRILVRHDVNERHAVSTSSWTFSLMLTLLCVFCFHSAAVDVSAMVPLQQSPL